MADRARARASQSAKLGDPEPDAPLLRPSAPSDPGDAFEFPAMRLLIRSASGTWLSSFPLEVFGEVVGMMSVSAEVFGRIAGQLVEECDIRRRSHVGVFSRVFSRLTLIGVVRDIRAAGAGATGVAR